MKQILPIIFIVLALTGAITYSLAKRTVPKKPIENIGISANQLEDNSTVTPTPTESKKVAFGSLVVATPTPSITPTAMPTIAEKEEATSSTKKVASTAVTTTKTTICTPVYGSADTCTEHVVVDTGAESAMFFNFAGFAYLAGLLAFVKAKSLTK